MSNITINPLNLKNGDVITESNFSTIDNNFSTIQTQGNDHDNRIGTLNIQQLESTGYGVINGLTVSAQTTPNMTVNVASGVVHMLDGNRLTPIGNSTLAINNSDSIRPRIDIIYVNSDSSIGYLAGTYPSTTAGKETYTIATNTVANDTVTINGVTFTAVSSGATGNQFNVGVDSPTTASNIVSALNSNSTINTLYTATSSTNIITLTEKASGGGNTPSQATYTGTIVITNGTAITSAVATPTVPSTPSGAFLLAQIYVGKGVTTIANDNITDKRIIKQNNNQIADKIGVLTGNGLTSNRPTNDLYVGMPYFDTTLNKPIWYNGTNWIDATGVTV